MKMLVRDILLLMVAAVLLACGNSRRRSSRESDSATGARYELSAPTVPPALQGEAAREYLRNEWWDEFDFTDTMHLAHLDRKQFMSHFARYVALVPSDDAARYMTPLMQRASGSKSMFSYFVDAAEQVLHNPNSPLRDAEKYIPVLEVVLQSDWLDEYEKLPYRHDLQIARQNRVGHRANDFAYTTADGRTRRLYALDSNYTLLFISNIGCGMCRDIKEQILSSALLCEAVESGLLSIVVLYPDEDLTAWREHLGDYPAQWINCYDNSGQLTREELYDLRAIPSLYLLDKEKRVLAKDCTDVGYIESLYSNHRMYKPNL